MAAGSNTVVNQYPPQQQVEYEYVYYYPEYEYIYVDYPYMPEFTNGYYEYEADGGNGYYQVIELDDSTFYNDPYFAGQGPFYLTRGQHQNKDYYFTNRKTQNRIQKFSISKRAFDDLTKKNEIFRKKITSNQEEAKPQQQPERRPVSNVQYVPMRPAPQPIENQRPNVAVTPLGGTRAPQPSQQQIPSTQYVVMGRQQVLPRGAVMVRAPVS